MRLSGFTRPARKGFRSTLRYSVKRSIGSTLGLVIGFALTAAVLAAVGRPMMFQHEQPDEAASVTPAPGSAGALILEHECWTNGDEMPADMVGKVPGHVVVTVDGHARYGGPRLVGKALDQVFNGVDHGLTVNAFCR